MTYDFYIKQPMQMVELEMNLLIGGNLHLINALDRSVSHPLVKEFSQIPFE